MTTLADGLQGQLFLLEHPYPLPERGIEKMDPALAPGLVRSTLDEFGNLDPIDLFTSGCNVGLDEGAKRAGCRGFTRTVGGTVLMRISPSREVHIFKRERDQTTGSGCKLNEMNTESMGAVMGGDENNQPEQGVVTA